jgi:hypothetical protein
MLTLSEEREGKVVFYIQIPTEKAIKLGWRITFILNPYKILHSKVGEFLKFTERKLFNFISFSPPGGT